MGFFLMILGSMLLLDGVAIVFCWRMAQGGVWGWIGVGFAVMQMAAFGLMILARGKGWRLDFTPAGWSSIYLWHFFGLALVLLMVTGAGLISGVRWGTGAGPMDPSRRAFLGAAAALTPLIFNAGLTAMALSQLPRFRVRRLTLPMPNLPAGLSGLTIAHVSDLHVGEFTRGEILEEIVERTNGLGADLICVTGDLINHAMRDLPTAIGLLRKLRAEHGVWVVEGNHDLIEDAAGFRQAMRESGLNFLWGESVVVTVRGEQVQLLGLPWTNHRGEGQGEAMAADVRAVLELREAGAFPIVLGHHPDVFDEAARHGVPLTLAGHTHGGQINLTDTIGFGPAIYQYWSGVYRKDGSTAVVSNGVGNWFPLRVNAPAEIGLLTLLEEAET